MWFKKDRPKEPVNEGIFHKVQSILVRQLNIDVEKIKLKSRINDDLGVDSLDAVETVMDLEQEFVIEIPDEDAEKMVTIEDIVRYIQANIVQANKPERKSSERDSREDAI